MDNGQVVLAAIAGRRSVRKYKKEIPTPDMLMELMNAALEAPNAKNEQEDEVLFIRDPELTARFSKEAGEYLEGAGFPEGYNPFYGAPVIIVITSNADSKMFPSVDAGAATENIALAAYAIDLGTCIVGSIRPFMDSEKSRDLKEALGLAPGRKFEIALVVGYPDEEPEDKGRDKEKVQMA